MTISFTLFFTFFLAAEVALWAIASTQSSGKHTTMKLSLKKIKHWAAANEPYTKEQIKMFTYLEKMDGKLIRYAKADYYVLNISQKIPILFYVLILGYFYMVTNGTFEQYDIVGSFIANNKSNIYGVLFVYFVLKILYWFIVSSWRTNVLSKQIELFVELISISVFPLPSKQFERL